MKGKQSPARAEPAGTVVPVATKVHGDPRTQRNPNSVLKAFKQWAQNPENKIKSKSRRKHDEETSNQGVDFMKRKQSDASEAVSGDSAHEVRLLHKLSAENIHLSRPPTPKKTPPRQKPHPDIDVYRVRYLLLKVEHELERTKLIVKQMQACDVKRSEVSSVTKVTKEVFHIGQQLQRILDNDPKTLIRIGSADDLDQFFQNVEKICNAAAEIKFEEDTDTEKEKEKKKFRLLWRINGGKERKTKESQSQTSLSKTQGNEQRQRPKNMHTKEELEKYRNKKRKQDEDRQMDGGKGTTKLHYESGAVESWSDTDTDEEMMRVADGDGSDGSKFIWPVLDTNDEVRLEKEKKLHNLMTEIDGLMEDVGLSDKRHSGLTYEVLMTGSGEKNFSDGESRKSPKIAKDTTKILIPVKKTAPKLKKQQTDKFDVELDKLLAECEKTK